jgi:hypothetical protein
MTPTPEAALLIDHVTIAGRSLAEMEAAFTEVGLDTTYGGPHSNGVTHMALLGFEDGSYIELISFLKPGVHKTAFWGDHIAADAGPCAWAVRSSDVDAEAKRIAAIGVTVDGPHEMFRERPDGARVAWNLAFIGDNSAGATLPFIIKDITPRYFRVQPSPNLNGQNRHGALLTGVKWVVLAVNAVPAISRLFQDVYHWPRPEIARVEQFGAKLAYFPGTPVVLAHPLTDTNWLADRLSRFNDLPCAYLLGSPRFEEACRHFGLINNDQWFGYDIAWFNPDKITGLKLGVIDQISF